MFSGPPNRGEIAAEQIRTAAGCTVLGVHHSSRAGVLVGDQLPVGSIYLLLAEHGGALFGEEYFADLFKRSTLGRPTVPARVVATVMLLQAYEGLSDREACDRLAFDLRWKAAAGVTVDAQAFHPTVLVGMRNRLRASKRPRRLFDDVNTTAAAAGLLRGRRRVLDSTPLFDAVATQDTVIQLRAVIRKVLAAAERVDPELASADAGRRAGRARRRTFLEGHGAHDGRGGS